MGSFSLVHSATLKNPLLLVESNSISSNDERSSTSIAFTARKIKYYALKRLRDLPGQECMVEAARDSAFEASILACLPPHENIVHPDGFLENPKQGFLLLDRLAQTLSFRLYRLKISKNLQAPSGMPSGKRRLGFFQESRPAPTRSNARGTATKSAHWTGRRSCHGGFALPQCHLPRSETTKCGL